VISKYKNAPVEIPASIEEVMEAIQMRLQFEFAERTLGMWANNPEIDKAFEELEERWQQWRDDLLEQTRP
jgi:hypothetical protein